MRTNYTNIEKKVIEQEPEIYTVPGSTFYLHCYSRGHWWAIGRWASWVWEKGGGGGCRDGWKFNQGHTQYTKYNTSLVQYHYLTITL